MEVYSMGKVHYWLQIHSSQAMSKGFTFLSINPSHVQVPAPLVPDPSPMLIMSFATQNPTCSSPIL